MAVNRRKHGEHRNEMACIINYVYQTKYVFSVIKIAQTLYSILNFMPLLRVSREANINFDAVFIDDLLQAMRHIFARSRTSSLSIES